MKYAADSRPVHLIYSITTGATRPIFILLVVLAVGVGLYFPIRDYYVAYRTSGIVSEQLAIREEYRDELQADVDTLLSKEGIENEARKLGMVKEGETRLDVIGADDTSSSDSSSGSASDSESTPTSAQEVEERIAAVGQDAPWYIKMLDKVFSFSGVEGQTVSSSSSN